MVVRSRPRRKRRRENRPLLTKRMRLRRSNSSRNPFQQRARQRDPKPIGILALIQDPNLRCRPSILPFWRRPSLNNHTAFLVSDRRSLLHPSHRHLPRVQPQSLKSRRHLRRSSQLLRKRPPQVRARPRFLYPQSSALHKQQQRSRAPPSSRQLRIRTIRPNARRRRQQLHHRRQSSRRAHSPRALSHPPQSNRLPFPFRRIEAPTRHWGPV